MLYSTNATGRITGHVGDHTSADALVLRLYYVVDQFTITYKSLGGQITEDDGTTPENVDRTVYYNHSYTPLPASQVKKTGYKLKGWTDVASGTVFNIKADGTFDTQNFLWDSNRVFEAIWEALSADVTVVHIKVDRNGNGTIAKTDTFPAIKDAGLTFTVAENGDTMPHDAETYVDRYGNVNTTLVTTDADKLFWLGYGHITSGPHSSVLIGGVLYTTSADGFGYERAVVNADGTTTIYVFYYAGGENDDIKVDYDVNIYKVDGNGNRVLVSSNTYQGYVDTTVHGNANKQGMAEGLAGNDDWQWPATPIATRARPTPATTAPTPPTGSPPPRRCSPRASTPPAARRSTSTTRPTSTSSCCTWTPTPPRAPTTPTRWPPPAGPSRRTAAT